MDRLRSFEVFAEVARDRSFSAAARRLGLSRAAVTKHVAQLERELQAQLLARTTRRVSLTDAGHALLREGHGWTQQYGRMEEAVRQSVRTERGVLHVGTPPSFAEAELMPLLCGFMQSHPGIEVKIHLDYNKEDIVEQGLDLTLRVAGSLKGSSLVAQRLSSVPQVLVASPEYLQRWGEPQQPEDLLDHQCLVHLLKSPGHLWSFTGPRGAETVKVNGKLSANFGEVLRQAALMHQGISLHPVYMVRHDLSLGRLRAVLTSYVPSPLEVHVLYPSRRHVPTRVRRFIEHLKAFYGP